MMVSRAVSTGEAPSTASTPVSWGGRARENNEVLGDTAERRINRRAAGDWRSS